MKVKALINLRYKKQAVTEGEIFEMTAEDFKNVNKNYVEIVQEAKKQEFKKSEEKEGVESDV